MAARLIWSRQSLDDLGSIAKYIGRDSPHHARRTVDAVLDLGDSIVQHPKLGRVVPELLNPLVRERFVYSYRVLYEIGEDQINVLAVIHGRRSLESLDNRLD